MPAAGPPAGGRSAPLVPGWALTGEVAEPRLLAAARVIRRLERHEDEIRSLSAEILARYEEASLLYRLGERLGAVLGEESIAEVVLSDAASVLGARAGEIWLRRGEELRRVAAVPAGASGTGDPATLPPTLRRGVLEQGRPWLREAGGGREAEVAVPLPGPDEPLGLLLLVGRPDGGNYRTGDEKLLAAVAALASSYVRNDRLVAEVRAADARRRQHEIARQIHRRLLPHEQPEVPGFELCGFCRPAETIGGDYYGYVPLADGSLGLAIADVSGHGVGAALYMASVKGVLQSEARREMAPARVLERLNEALWSDFSRSDVFATTVVARLEIRERAIRLANGGHNPPLLIRAGGDVEELAPGGGALGLVARRRYREERLPLRPGDVLVLYTDGLVDARDPEDRFYGAPRLRELVAGARGESAETIRARIEQDLDRHRGTRPLADDVTVVVLRATGAPVAAIDGEPAR